MSSTFLLVARILLLLYVLFLLVQCVVYLVFYRTKKLDRRNLLMHGLVLLSLVLTATHICVNIWGSCVSGKSPEECKAWRGMSVILYPACLVPVTVLLWVRQKFFYELNMVRRSTEPWILKLSHHIIYPIMTLFVCLIVFFFLLYFTPYLSIMEYEVKDGKCFNLQSRGSVFRVIGLLMIIVMHCILLYLFIVPIKSNLMSNTNNAGKVMETKSMSKLDPKVVPQFKSIKELDRALIKKMAGVTGLVIASDVVCILVYVGLKYGGVELSGQSLSLDIQVLITSISNVLCWKHWKQIILPNLHRCPEKRPSLVRRRIRTASHDTKPYSAQRRTNSGNSDSNKKGSAPVVGSGQTATGIVFKHVIPHSPLPVLLEKTA